MKKSQPSPEQFELDLVHPCFGVREPTLDEARKFIARADLKAPQTIEDVQRLRSLLVRLSWMDLTPDAGRLSIGEELETARVLLGPEVWNREKQIWKRRAKRSPLQFQKWMLVLKKKYVG